jgi:hypothetical protein
VVIAAYETMYRKNPDAAKRIHQEVFNSFCLNPLFFERATIIPGTLPVAFVMFD